MVALGLVRIEPELEQIAHRLDRNSQERLIGPLAAVRKTMDEMCDELVNKAGQGPTGASARAPHSDHEPS